MKKYFIKYSFITGTENVLSFTDKDKFEICLEQKENDDFVLRHTIKTWEVEGEARSIEA